jgi:putative DNA primase/helicase
VNPDTTFHIARAPKRNSKRWSRGRVSWGEICSWLDDPADVKEAGNYLLGELSSNIRGRHTIVSRGVLTLDADAADPGLPDLVELALPVAVAMHTTYSSAPDNLRLRMLLPLSRPATPEEYEALADLVMDKLGRAQFDEGSREAARYMFMPATTNPDWYRRWVLDGDPLDVDAWLATWDRDLSSRSTPKLTKRDPYSLAGVVGAFNRAYSIQEAIDAYDLPYEPVDDRWHLVGATAEAGVNLVSDGVVYSHHASDPAGGQACTAFDLVRLHRFADLDAVVPEDTPIQKLPSHAAMMELAASDPRVVAELVNVDFDALTGDMDMDGDVPDDRWRMNLQMNPRNGTLRDVIGNWDLIKANDPAFAGLYFNELTMAIETDTDMPWRVIDKGGPIFGAADRAALAHYIEREYGIRPLRYLLDELVTTKAMERRVNPVRDYLLGLTWDGTPRVETCLPGVRPTAWTRLVARKCITAAVARMFEPGIKWDHTLVLYGDEGLGKSYWIEKLSRGYAATLGRIDNKDTLLTMQRSWIMVADEGYSLRKADSDAQKEFLTRTEDVFRMPYDREPMVHPRHCVIWSTTNDEVFLRRQEGNRRFLIVQCEDPVDFTELTDEYIDQIWAEAVHLYRAGERLYLDGEQAVEARHQRERFTEEDVLGGFLQGFLDTPVPEDWEERSPESRILWRTTAGSELSAVGTKKLERVCAAEIWIEALGGRWANQRRTDLLEISTALKKIPGWRQLPGRHHVPNYGPQVVFVRDDTLDQLL